MVIQSTSKVKAGQLWSKGKEDLKKQLIDLKTELGALRTQKIAGGAASKLTKMYRISALIPSTSTFFPYHDLLRKQD